MPAQAGLRHDPDEVGVALREATKPKHHNPVNTTDTAIDIDDILTKHFAWDDGREITTKRGLRILKKAPSLPQSRQAWQDHKDALKSKGVVLSEWPAGSNRWSFAWFKEIPADVIEQRQESVEMSWAASADVDYPRPAGLEYMPFQRAGIRYCLSKPGTVLGDEMGLGKTIQVIGTINADPTIKRVLIACPASLALNWRAELRKWLVRPMTVVVSEPRQLPSSGDIIIVTYPNVHKVASELRNRQWDLIALDEAHYLKGRKTLRTSAILGLKPTRKESEQQGLKPIVPLTARKRIVVTGTPILNASIELFGLLNWVCPERFGSWWTFAKTYTPVMGGRNDLEALNRHLRESCMIRRMKKDVLTELPAKVRKIQLLEDAAIVKRERAAIDRILEQSASREQLQADAELAKAAGNIEEYQNAVRQLQGIGRIPFEEISRVRHETAVAKAPMVVEEVKELLAQTEKVLVFGHHRDVLDILQQGLAEYGTMRIDGGMDKAERDAAVQAFQNDRSVRVGILSIMAAGVGLTLTKATLVVFAEEDWVPANMTQAEDRAHRIGQKDTVTVIHMILSGSLDERMTQLNVEKQDIADRALNNRLTPEQEQELRARLSQPTNPLAALGQRGTHVSPTSEWISKMAEALTVEAVELIHQGLKAIAGVCDGARRRDEAGFNGVDTRIGKSLAWQDRLSRRQAALGLRLCRKYRGQIGSLWEAIAAAAGVPVAGPARQQDDDQQDGE